VRPSERWSGCSATDVREASVVGGRVGTARLSAGRRPAHEPAAGRYGRGVTRRQVALLLLLSAIWGASFLFIKVGVRQLSPSVVALSRLSIGTIVLLPLAAIGGGLAPLRGKLRPVLVLGLFNNALPFWLLGFAETRIASGFTAVIQAAAPVFTALLAGRIDPSQRVTRARLAGIAIGFVGVALLVGNERGGQLVGAVAVIGVALCYAFSVLYAGRAARDVPPLQLSIGQLGCAALLEAPLGIVQLPSSVPGWKPLAAVVTLGAVGTGVAYLLYFALIHEAGASKAILVTYLVPAFALLYGATVLDEAVSARAVGGLALILGGTALATGVALGVSRKEPEPAGDSQVGHVGSLDS
jgi:drug/metabolite transporter (DMT)-like permease